MRLSKKPCHNRRRRLLVLLPISTSRNSAAPILIPQAGQRGGVWVILGAASWRCTIAATTVATALTK